jgi:oxygen-independent coproporphyrinogen III oxidase
MLETGNHSIYFHIPFCSKKCPYCHFYVVPDREDLKKLLLEGLQKEWSRQLPQLQNKTIRSIYFGGGTPFLFGAKAISTLLKNIAYDPSTEITLEVNPEHVTEEAIKAYADIGINRVSLGIQSLDDSSLNILGRRHSAAESLQAIQAIEKAGISNISLDLMYDLPHQTLSSWRATLQQIEDLPVTHISLYNLTFEPHTPFFKKQKVLSPHLPTPEESLKMIQEAVTTLECFGFKRYEISAFARPGSEAVHNSGYWTGQPFLGFGPSAFSYWEGKRFRNVANLHKYCDRLKEEMSPVDFEEELRYPANVHELLAIHLRLLEGVSLIKYPLPDATIHTLDQLKQRGFVSIEGSHVKLTEQGLLFYDSVAEELI